MILELDLGAEHLRVLGRVRTDRSREIDQRHYAVVTAVAAVPSSASSVRPSDIATQVKMGVSRSVYELDSVPRSSCTRSRNSPGSSPSKETTNSWSSRPKEYAVLIEISG